MRKRSFRNNKSGQVIVITALLIAVLSISTAIYVIETERQVPQVDSNETNSFSAYKQAMTNTLISALANITNGGDSTILAVNLDELKEAIVLHSYQSMFQLDFTLINSSPYQNGIYLSWGTNGYGISSTCVDFALKTFSFSTTSSLTYTVGVATEAHLAGNCLQINDTADQVNLIINLLNEGKPALGRDFSFYFQNASRWLKVDKPTVIDFYNGTYTASFIAETGQLNENLLVSMLCWDQRFISVGANLTLTNVE
jgi:hypothetical protein